MIVCKAHKSLKISTRTSTRAVVINAVNADKLFTLDVYNEIDKNLKPYLGLDVQDPQEFLGFMKGTLERFIIYPTLVGFLILVGYLSRN
jgi:hypothetical protein